MRLVHLLFLLTLRGGIAQRVADPLIEVDFLKPACVVDRAFPVTAGSLSDFEFVSMAFDPTFTCPVITFNNVTFTDASNGFKPVEDASIISNNPVPADAFGNDKPEHFFEFFLFVGDFEDTERFSLFELGRNGFGETLNAWNPRTDFLFRISLRKAGSVLQLFADLFDVAFGTAINLTPETGPLIHIGVGLKRPDIPDDLVQVVTVSFFLDGEEIAAVNQGVTGTEFLFDNVNGDVFFTLGMSFNALVTGSTEPTMPYDMHKFAIYDKPLLEAEVLGNLEASVANSLPAGANIDIEHREDIDTLFTFEDIFATFDFDRDILQVENELIEFIIETTVDSEVGDLLDGAEQEVPVDQVFPLFTNLLFRQRVPNEDDEVATIDYFLIQNGDVEQRSLDTNRINLNFVEENDPPVALNNIVEIAESQINTVRLLAEDPLDVGDGKNPDFFPQKVVILTLTVEEAFVDGVQEPVGEFVNCTDTNIPIEVDDEFDIVQVGDEFFAEVCFQSGEFDVSDNAVIGRANIEFKVVDEVDSLNVASTTVEVLQALFAGCQFLDPAKCETIEFEVDATQGDGIVIELQFFDSRCDEAEINGQVFPPVIVDQDVCTERFNNREAVIVGPLPDADTEGQFIYIAENNLPTPLTEDDLDENNQFILPEGNRFEEGVFRINFTAAPRYFNLSPFPFCNRDISNRAGNDDVLYPERGDCFDFLFTDRLRCSGKFCDEPLGQVEGFSTALFVDDDFEEYGNCRNAELIDDGCPIRLFTRLKILDGFSPLEENGDPTQIIWIKNSIEPAARRDIPALGNQSRTIIIEEGDVDDDLKVEPLFQLVDGEDNARIALVYLSIDRDSSFRVEGIEDFLDLDSEVNAAFIDADPLIGAFQNNSNFDAFEPTGHMTGPIPKINKFLEGLRVKIVERNSILVIEAQDPYQLGSTRDRTKSMIVFTFDEDEVDQTDLIDIFLNPYIFGGLGLCCFISCFCCWRCFKNDTCGCVWLGGRAKLTVKKAVYSDKRMKGSIEDEDVETKGKEDDSSRRNRGKAKQAIPKSHRKTDPSKVKSRRAHIPKDSHRKKKGPVQSHRKNPADSNRSRGSSSDSGSSRNNPSKGKVYKKRLPPKSHRNES